jgi:predicted 2-oxoglutarate/Fe(II)-dependent dioxygenase YbiX/peroxiredoxin
LTETDNYSPGPQSPGSPAGLRLQAEPPFKVPPEALAIGDRAPNFILPDAKGEFRAFYERVRGRPLALLMLPAGADRALLDRFAARRDGFEAKGFDVMAILAGEVAEASAESERLQHPFAILADPKGAVLRGFAAGARVNPEFPACFLLDANQRLLNRRSEAIAPTGADAERLGVLPLEQWSLAGLSEPVPAAAQILGNVAPVLLLPNVLERITCDALIDRWTRAGHEEGMVDSIVDGEEVTRVHPGMKRRLDHAIQDPNVLKALAATIGRRIAPELVKAFHFDSFRFDRFIVTCYDAERGDYFRAHRDNASDSNADRRFALTLNLNSGEYEGGELVFPEYGPHRYAPPAGGAILFSCSLLHEALPVTKGRRFTLLSFLRAVEKPAQAAGATRTGPAPTVQPPAIPAPAVPAGTPQPGFRPGAPISASAGQPAAGFNPGGGFAPGVVAPHPAPAQPAPAKSGSAKPGSAKPASDKPVPFQPGMPSKNGLTRAGD